MFLLIYYIHTIFYYLGINFEGNFKGNNIVNCTIISKAFFVDIIKSKKTVIVVTAFYLKLIQSIVSIGLCE
jgi:hypothetical protein